MLVVMLRPAGVRSPDYVSRSESDGPPLSLNLVLRSPFMYPSGGRRCVPERLGAVTLWLNATAMKSPVVIVESGHAVMPDVVVNSSARLSVIRLPVRPACLLAGWPARTAMLSAVGAAWLSRLDGVFPLEGRPRPPPPSPPDGRRQSGRQILAVRSPVPGQAHSS